MLLFVFLASNILLFAVTTLTLFKCSNRQSPSKEKEAAAKEAASKLSTATKTKTKSTQPSGPLPSSSTAPSNVKNSTATTSNEKVEKVIIAKTPGSKVTNEEDGDYENLTQDENNKSHHPLVEIVQTPGGQFVKTTPSKKNIAKNRQSGPTTFAAGKNVKNSMNQSNKMKL
jgi:ClpP class serine protease